MKNSPQIRTLLYASDLGGQTRPVFRHAMFLARHYRAKIVMIHVVEPISEGTKAIIMSYLSQGLDPDVQKMTLENTLSTMKNRLKKFYFDENCDEEDAKLVKEVVVVAGQPSEEILRVAQEQHADMIVLGKSTRKVHGVRLLGSTARRVSRMSRLPVLLVPNY